MMNKGMCIKLEIQTCRHVCLEVKEQFLRVSDFQTSHIVTTAKGTYLLCQTMNWLIFVKTVIFPLSSLEIVK